MLLGDPGRVSAGRSQGAPEAVAGGRGCRVAPDMAWVASVSVGRQVLVELVDVKGLHVGHHLVADLADVHVAEVDVGLSPFPQGAPFPLGVSFACLQLSLRGGGRRGGAMALTCKVKNILRRKERGEGELLLSTWEAPQASSAPPSMPATALRLWWRGSHQMASQEQIFLYHLAKNKEG